MPPSCCSGVENGISESRNRQDRPLNVHRPGWVHHRGNKTTEEHSEADNWANADFHDEFSRLNGVSGRKYCRYKTPKHARKRQVQRTEVSFGHDQENPGSRKDKTDPFTHCQRTLLGDREPEGANQRHKRKHNGGRSRIRCGDRKHERELRNKNQKTGN